MALLRLRYVHSFVDKTGRPRFYFRYRGQRWPLPGEPGTSEFAAAYSEAKAKARGGEPQLQTPANLRYSPKSLGHVIDRYAASNGFTKVSAGTQRRYRPILEELKRHYGGARIADLHERHIREIRKRFASASTADLATMLLRMLWTFAKDHLALNLGVNPASEIRKLHRHHEPYEPWPQELIDRFEIEARPQPTARLALLLLLYTGQRVSDVAAMQWHHYDGDSIEVSQAKTKAKLTIPCHSRLKTALDAAARAGGSVLTTQYSKPYSAHGLSTLVQVATARLGAKQYTAHGLRCNAAIGLAEVGCSIHQIMSITGHKTYKLAMHYSQRAGQKTLARQAIDLLENANKVVKLR